MICVDNHNNRSLSLHYVCTSRKRLVGHIVFHNIHQAKVGLLGFTRKLVKSHNIPVTNKAYFTVTVVYKQLSLRNLTSRNQYTMRRQFRENMRFTSTLWTKLNQVIIIFSKRNQTSNL